MKTILKTVPLFALMGLLIAGCSGNGCASSPSSYKTLASVQAATTASLKAFAEARVKGQVDDATYGKINALYQKYQASYAAAVTAAQLNPSAATPPEVEQLATELASAIAQAVGGAK